MLRFRAGDVRAFDALLRRHRSAVFTFILRFCGDRARAEDLLQETWLKVVRSAPEYAAKAKFTTWLYTIARNQCIDLKRREAFRKTESLDSPMGATTDDDRSVLSTQPDAGAVSPDRAAHAARLRPAIKEALAALPVEQREVFCMREWAGMQFKEIAEATGVPENTVKSRMRYALEGLRKTLCQMGIDGDLASEPKMAG